MSGVLRGGTALVSKVIQTIPAATDTGAVTDALAVELNRIISDTANDAGVAQPSAQSVRSATGEPGGSVKAQATAIYQSIDKAIVGTRFQTFDEQLSQVRQDLRNSANIDYDAHGELLQKVSGLENAKQLATDLAISNGIGPAILHTATAKWAQGSALLDLQKQLKESATGLRPEHQVALKPGQAASPESPPISSLAKRANRLFNSGRLAQALSPDSANDLLRVVESARLRETQVAANRTVTGHVLRGAVVAGAGAVGADVYEGVKHYLGN